MCYLPISGNILPLQLKFVPEFLGVRESREMRQDVYAHLWVIYGRRQMYEGVSINNQPIPFPMDRDGHDFHALFQCMFYTWVQNCTRIESFFNKILNVKHG